MILVRFALTFQFSYFFFDAFTFSHIFLPSLTFQTGVTVNKYSGVITTATGTTVPNGCEGFPFSNSKIEATSIVQVSIMSYSGTYGTDGIPTVAISATDDGAATIQICNGGSSNLNGVLKIAFLVLK